MNAFSYHFSMRAFIAIAVTSTFLLSGCVGISPAQPEAREASIRGSRLCFVKKGNGFINVKPSADVAANAVNPTGEAGDITDSERCFTGYNAYNDHVYDPNPNADNYSDVTVDVSSPVGPIRFLAINHAIAAPEIGYDVDFSSTTRDGKFFTPSEGDKESCTYRGYKFTIERRGDSANYKEFLVTFITPAN
jgi:hypothetical protein